LLGRCFEGPFSLVISEKDMCNWNRFLGDKRKDLDGLTNTLNQIKEKADINTLWIKKIDF